MKAALLWLWDRKWILFLFAGGVIALVLRAVLGGGGEDGPDPMEGMNTELKAIDAARDARQARIDLGEERALQQVKEKYADQKEQMDADATAKVAKYENDPVALARAMERASRG